MRRHIALLWLVAACSFPQPEDVAPDGDPGAFTITMVSGDGQSASAGSALAMPLIVAVANGAARPVENFTVEFVVTSGAASLAESTVRTDAQGHARTELMLGTMIGTSTVEARATGAQGSPVTFGATALVGAASRIVAISGDSQSAIAGSVLAAPLVVAVEDMHGNRVPGFTVDFVPTAGGGSVPATSVATDAEGIAQTEFTLGTTARGNTIEARGAGLTPVVFSALGNIGVPTQLERTSGDDQFGSAGDVLGAPFVATVRDVNGNPVPGVAVDFVVTAGGGSISTSSMTTNAQGQALTTLTLGVVPAANRVEARAAGLTGSPAVFDATGIVGDASSIDDVSGTPQTGTVATALAPFVVEVRDAPGNPVPDFSVEFVITAGNGSLSVASAITNAQGRAQTTMTLGATAGANRVEARAAGVGGSPVVFEAIGIPGPAALLSRVSGNNQTAGFGARLAAPLVVRVTDVHDNPVAATVSFVVTLGGGSVAPASVATNTAGLAQAVATLGTTPGTNRVEARVTGLASVVFTATGRGFRAKVDVAVPFAVEDVAIGDLNGDDKPDVVVTLVGGNSVLVFLNTTGDMATTPTFAPFVQLGAGGTTHEVALADINADGKLDLVLPLEDDGFTVRLNTTTDGSLVPTFVLGVRLPGLNRRTISIGDVNGDGMPDVALGANSSAAIHLNTTVANTSTVTFTPALELALGDNDSEAELADVDGDGRPDLIGVFQFGASAPTDGIVVRLNTTLPMATTASFATGVRFGTVDRPSNLAFADVNADNKIDVAAAGRLASNSSVLLNATTTTLSFTGGGPLPGGNRQDIALADLNGDLRPDLVTLSDAAGSAQFHVGVNTTATSATVPSFQAQVSFATGDDAVAFAIADLNNDGRLDVVTAGAVLSVVLAE